MERFAVMVKSPEGKRLVCDSGGARWETRWLTSIWAIEDSKAEAERVAAELRAGGPMSRAFVVPERDRYFYVGLH